MAEPVCPYCRMPFGEAGSASVPPRIFCTACGTPHHEDCYQENGGCTVFGCSCAPADDPKLQVSQSDLQAVSLSVQPYSPAQPSVPVQRQSPAPQYPPSVYGGPLGLSQAAAPARSPSTGQLLPPPNAANYGQSVPYAPQPVLYANPPKSRTAYIVLGIFLGALGIHNFYAGYTGRAVGQLCLTILTIGWLAIAAWIWAIVEICIVEKDSEGQAFN